MKLINPNELMANLIMEFDDDNNEVTKFWLNKIEEELHDCQDYSILRTFDHKPTEEEIISLQLGWNPELTLVEYNGYSLILEVDAFNDHIYWNVAWTNKYDGLKHSVEFTDFVEAREYFLKVISE